MKFYVAARFSDKERVKSLYKTIKEAGHEIIYDWTTEDNIKPYAKNQKLAEKYAIKSIDASKNCEVFVLLSDELGTAMYAELGAAMASKKPKIYVIGDFLDRSLLFFHPSVKRRKVLEQVLKEI